MPLGDLAERLDDLRRLLYLGDDPNGDDHRRLLVRPRLRHLVGVGETELDPLDLPLVARRRVEHRDLRRVVGVHEVAVGQPDRLASHVDPVPVGLVVVEPAREPNVQAARGACTSTAANRGDRVGAAPGGRPRSTSRGR